MLIYNFFLDSESVHRKNPVWGNWSVSLAGCGAIIPSGCWAQQNEATINMVRTYMFLFISKIIHHEHKFILIRLSHINIHANLTCGVNKDSLQQLTWVTVLHKPTFLSCFKSNYIQWNALQVYRLSTVQCLSCRYIIKYLMALGCQQFYANT